MSSCLRRPGEEEGSPAQKAGTWTEGHPTILAPPGGPQPGSSWDTVGGMLKGSGPRQGDKPGLLSRRTRSMAGTGRGCALYAERVQKQGLTSWGARCGWGWRLDKPCPS